MYPLNILNLNVKSCDKSLGIHNTHSFVFYLFQSYMLEKNNGVMIKISCPLAPISHLVNYTETAERRDIKNNELPCPWLASVERWCNYPRRQEREYCREQSFRSGKINVREGQSCQMVPQLRVKNQHPEKCLPFR